MSDTNFSDRFYDIKERIDGLQATSAHAKRLAENVKVMAQLAELPDVRLCAIYGTNNGLPLRAGWALGGRNVSNLNGDPVWDKLRTGSFYIDGLDEEDFTDAYWDYDGFRYTATDGMKWHNPSSVVFIYKIIDRTMTEQEYMHILNTPEEKLREEWEEARRKQ